MISKPLPRDANGKLTREVYQHSEWYRLRNGHLKRNRYCVYCEELGIVTRGSWVDHRIPHRGDDDLFFDKNNLQTLCATCHNSPKQREEKTGGQIGCDENGWPRGEQNHWNGAPTTRREDMRKTGWIPNKAGPQARGKQ